MTRLVRILISLFTMSITANSYAVESAPLTYSRTSMTIIRKHLTALPWQPADTSPNITLDVEVREAASMYNQKGWYDLSSPSEKTGILMAFSVPTMASPVSRTAQYAPLDVLFMDKEGKIIQILPNIVLSELEQDIYPASPALAFLFLKGGSSAVLSISPGDEAEYKLFKKPPLVLTTPLPTPQPSPNQPEQPKPLHKMTSPHESMAH